MSGDYLKQIQLTKQLEQKTKEAAKNRKEAEGGMAAAEKAIASVKSFDAPSAAAEKALEEARQALQQKDYKSALSLAKRSIDACEASKAEKVSSMVETAGSLLQLFEEASYPKEVSSLRSRSKELLQEGKLEEAHAKANELWTAVERFVNSEVADMLATAQSQLLLAEKMGVDVEGGRQMLLQARRNLEKEKFQDSVAQIRDCMEITSSSLRNLFSSKADGLSVPAELAAELGTDFAKANETLGKARSSAEAGDFEQAFGTLGIAESEARSIVTKGLLARIDALRERVNVLKGMGLNVASRTNAINKARELARAERIEEGMDAWRQAEQMVHTQEIDHLLNMISKLRGRLLIAKRIGCETNEVMAGLEEARRTMKAGDFKMAAAQVNQAEADLERILEGYRDVEADLNKTRNLMTTAIDLDLNITSAKKKVDSARKLVLNRDFERAQVSLHEAQDVIHSDIQTAIGQDIMRAEMQVTSAMKLGADVNAESAMLEDVIARAKSGQYEGIQKDMAVCLQGVEAKIRAVTEQTLTEAKNLLDTYTGPVDISSHRLTLQSANEALKEGQSVRAYELAMRSMEMVKRDESSALDQRLDESRRLLAIAKEIGSESIMLNGKVAKAEQLRASGNMADSLRVAAEVLQFARSMIKDELTRQLTVLTRSLSSARRNGIEVLQAERLAEDSSRAVEKGDLIKGYSLFRESESSLERTTVVHKRIYERVVEINSMLKEAEEQGQDASGQKEMLAGAKRLFEAGKYEDALPGIAKTFVETERLVAPYIAPRKAQAAQGLISAAKRLGFEVGAPQKRLDRTLDLIGKKEYAQAMASVREVEKAVVSIVSHGVERELASIKSKLEKAKASGSDVTGMQQTLVKVESLIRERRINDALMALDLTKSELEQGLLMKDAARESIERARATVKDGQEFGVDVTAAKELLRQAGNWQKMGRNGIAHELAKKAGDQVAILSAEMVRARVARVEEERRASDLEGTDLEPAMRTKREIEGRIEARRFREAAAQVEIFEDQLREVGAQQELAAKAARDLEAKIREAKAKGIPTSTLEPAAEQAQECFRRGSFEEANALLVTGLEQLRGQVDQYDRRLSELKELEEEVAQLEGDETEATAKELMERAMASIASSDFESATMQIRRAKESAKQAQESVQAQRVKSLEGMCLLAQEMKVSKSSIPKVVKEVTRLRGTGTRPEPQALRKAVDAMGEVMAKKIGARMEAVRDEVAEAERSGADVAASEELLAQAKALLAEGKWREASECTIEAGRTIGVAVEEAGRFKDLSRQVEESIMKARRNGLDMSEALRHYQEAVKLKAKDHKAALAKVEGALRAAARAAEDFLPDIQVDLHFEEPLRRGEWSKAKLNLSNEAKAMAREVLVSISGDLEMRGFQPLPKLRGGEKLSVDVEVRPAVEGKAHVSLGLECRPVLSNDRVGYDSEFDVEV